MEKKSRLLKIFGRLEVIVFVAGAVVMILELIGSRILAPFLGTSIFVWTSLIGLILGALSFGYYLGGYFSKNNPSFKFLSLTLILAGFFVLLIALIKEPVLNFSMNFGIKIGSIFATTILFVIPSILLGMISPYSVRLKIKSLETSGSAAGNLYAISTVGSIFGTFLAGFWFIPTFGSLNILFGLGLILILTSFLGLPNKFIASRFFLLIFMVFVLVLSNYLSALQGFIVDTDSSYNHIRVFDTISDQNKRPLRILMIGNEIHSALYLDTKEMGAKYTKFYRLDSVFRSEIKSALVIGGGAYLQPSDLVKRFSDIQIDVVEIDPEVTKTAKEYFGFKENPQTNIYHQDGRIFLNNNKKKYDAIYIDAFLSSYSIPFQLTTLESVKKIYDSLTENGVVLVNMVSSLDGEKSIFFKSEYKTFAEVFPHLYVFPIYTQQEDAVQNIMLVVSKSEKKLSPRDLLNRANTQEEIEYVNHLDLRPVNLEGIKILTDDFAPVDYYISKFL